MNRNSFQQRVHAWLRVAVVACLAGASFVAEAEAPLGAQVRTSPRQVAPETEARVIVKFKAEPGRAQVLSARSVALPQRAQALSARLGVALRDGRALGARSQLVFATGLSSRALAARLATHPDVEYAVVDGRQRALSAPSDPLYGAGQTGTSLVAGQWYLRTPDASTPAAIDAEAAWRVTTGKGSVVVAVLDTGVRPEHPDLQGKLFPGYDFVHDISKAGDGDARDADASDPGDAVAPADVGSVVGCSADDVGTSSWHGTKTAGLLGAATDNGIGMASIGRDVMVLPVRVLGKCGGYDSDILDAMRWAAGVNVPGVPVNAHPARVINLSLGSAGACTAAFQDVIDELGAAGVVVVAAAGNDGLAVGMPANCAGVVAVAGLRHLGTKVGYSNLGPEITIGAPAGNCTSGSGPCQYALLTTTNAGRSGPAASTYTDADSGAAIGTSFATPLVAGTVALMLTVNAELTPAQVIGALQASARPYPSSGAAAGVRACVAGGTQNAECYCSTATCGAGMLDAGAALRHIARLGASISAPAAPVATAPIVLDGSGSVASDAAISSYDWSISNDTAHSSFSSATNAVTATLIAASAGTVTVTLTVTDALGHQSASTVVLTIGAAPSHSTASQAPVSSTSTATSASTPAAPAAASGGGALALPELLALLGAALALVLVRGDAHRIGARADLSA